MLQTNIPESKNQIIYLILLLSYSKKSPKLEQTSGKKHHNSQQPSVWSKNLYQQKDSNLLML